MKKIQLITIAALMTALFASHDTFCMKRKRDVYETPSKPIDRKKPKKKRKIAYPKYKRVRQSENQNAEKLIQAIKNKNPNEVQKILNENAELVHSTILVGKTYYESPLHHAIGTYSKLKRSAETDKIKVINIIKIILKKNADPNEKGSRYSTPLNKILQTSCAQDLIKLLIKYGAKEYNKWSSIQQILQHGGALLENVKILIDENLLDVNEILFFNNKHDNRTGYTLLHLAAENIKSTNWILDNENFDDKIKNQPNSHGQTPLHIALKMLTNKKRISRPQIHTLKRLITQETINNLNKNKETPISVAFQAKNLLLVQLLIKHGAIFDKEWINVNGQNYLHLAATSKNLKAVEYLIKKGFDVNAQDKSGNTPLFLLSKLWLGYNHDQRRNQVNSIINIAKLLIENGAIINTIHTKETFRSQTTTTPFSMAMREKHYELAELLAANGADVNRNVDHVWFHSKYRSNSEFSEFDNFIIKNGLTFDFYERENKLIRKIEYLKKILDKTQHIEQHSTNEQAIIEGINQSIVPPLKKYFHHNSFSQLVQRMQQKSTNESYAQKMIQFIQNQIHSLDKQKTFLEEHLTSLRQHNKPMFNLYQNSITMYKLQDKLRKFVKYIAKEGPSYSIEQKEKRTGFINRLITDIRHLVLNDQLSAYHKLIILDYMAELDLTGTIRLINDKLDYNIRIDWINLLKKIPFNYDLLSSRNLSDLREIACNLYNKRNELNIIQTRDINGKTFLESAFNHIPWVNHLLNKNWNLFFTEDTNELGTPQQIKPLLKNLLMGRLSQQEVIEHPFVKTIAQRIMPLQIGGNQSYKQNPYHKNFINWCSIFSLLQYYFAGDITANITKYIDPMRIFTNEEATLEEQEERSIIPIEDYKTYTPSIRFFALRYDLRSTQDDRGGEDMDTSED